MANIKFHLPIVFILVVISLTTSVCVAKNDKREDDSMQHSRVVALAPISQIGFKVHDARSPIEEFGIDVKEYPENKIIIRSFEIWKRNHNGFDKEATLSKEEYENLWKKMQRFDVWSLEDFPYSSSFHPVTHDFIFSKAGKTHKIYAQDLPQPLSDIVLLLDRVAKEKLGVSHYNSSLAKS